MHIQVMEGCDTSWAGVSAEAKQLITSLLTVAPGERLDAPGLLGNGWVQRGGREDADMEAERRVVWIRHHLRMGNFDEANALGWDGGYELYDMGASDMSDSPTSVQTISEPASPVPPPRRPSPPTTSSTLPMTPPLLSLYPKPPTRIPTMPHPLGKHPKVKVKLFEASGEGEGGVAGPSSAAPPTAPPIAPPIAQPSSPVRAQPVRAHACLARVRLLGWSTRPLSSTSFTLVHSRSLSSTLVHSRPL